MTIIESIVQLCQQEWTFFGKQEFGSDGKKVRDGMSETDEGFWQRVAVYWLEGTGKNLSGKNDDFPWSAAFVSYVMRRCGAGERFRYSAQHSVYIRAAIKARSDGKSAYGFWGYRIAERAPEVGDLVCYARQPGVSFDTPSSNYKAHVDIVVGKKANAIQVIGGNVGNSVSLKHLSVDGQGLLADKKHAWFAVLANRLERPV